MLLTMVIVVHTTPRKVMEGKPKVGIIYSSAFLKGSPGHSDGKESAYNAGDPILVFLGREVLWRGKWQPTPVLLPRKSHGWRSLVSMGSQRVGHD